MQRTCPSLLLVAAALSFVACGDDSGSSPTPPVAATPAPTPTPSPTATPGNPMASVSAVIFKYMRSYGPESERGVFHVPPSRLPPYFITGDAIDVSCTPRDAAGRETPNHPTAIEWYYTSGGPGVLVDKVDYYVIDDNTFIPQIQIRSNTRSGYIDMWCRVGGYESNHLHMEVRYVEPD